MSSTRYFHARSVLAVVLLLLLGCGGESAGLQPPRSDSDERKQAVIDGIWPWPVVQSYCDPENEGFRIWVTAQVASGIGSGGAVAVYPDSTCLLP